MAFNLNEAKDWTIPDLLKNQEFRAFCAGLYDSIRPTAIQKGLSFFDQELQHFRGIYMGSETIQKVKTQSVATTFINIMTYGTSINPTAKALAYITPRDGEIRLKISPYGGLAIRLDSGVLEGVQGPYIVHEGDFIELPGGKVSWVGKNKSTKIIGGWIRLIKQRGIEDDKYFTMEQIRTYQAKSPSKDGYAWTGGVLAPDGTKQPTLGMLEAKIMSHAMDTLPLFKLNPGMELATDEDMIPDREAIYANAMSDITTPIENTIPIPTTEEIPEPTPTISQIPTFF